MTLEIDPDRRAELTQELQTLFRDEFDIDLSEFRAEQVLDFALRTIGPSVYNQAVQDTRRYLQEKLDDLEGDVRFEGFTLR